MTGLLSSHLIFSLLRLLSDHLLRLQLTSTGFSTRPTWRRILPRAWKIWAPVYPKTRSMPLSSTRRRDRRTSSEATSESALDWGFLTHLKLFTRLKIIFKEKSKQVFPHLKSQKTGTTSSLFCKSYWEHSCSNLFPYCPNMYFSYFLAQLS